MTICVRSVCPESEEHELLRILQANLPALDHARRFDWLYRANPDGPAWSWFACERPSGHAVGVTSVFPRSMWISGRVEKCGQVGDFAVSASHRSLGPAILLQRATFEPVERGKISFCYDCPPHEAGMSTFRRLGMHSSCTVERFALPLRVDRRMRAGLGPTLAFLVTPANILLRAYLRPRPIPKGLEIVEHAGLFGEEFSELDAAIKTVDAIRSRRSAAHLNWRYRQDPLHEYRVLTGRCKGELIAFIVYCTDGEDLTIVDYFGTNRPDIATAMLDAVVQRHGSSHQVVEAFLSDGNELARSFMKARFRRRSVAARVVAYAKQGSDTSKFLESGARWAFSQCDVRA